MTRLVRLHHRLAVGATAILAGLALVAALHFASAGTYVYGLQFGPNGFAADHSTVTFRSYPAEPGRFQPASYAECHGLTNNVIERPNLSGGRWFITVQRGRFHEVHECPLPKRFLQGHVMGLFRRVA